MITEISDNIFEEKVIEQSKKTPVVVDFYSNWCPPCRMLAPILEKLADDYRGKFILAKANTDNARKTAEEYCVMSIPSVKLFKNGKVVAEFVGALPESEVKQWLDENL